MGDFGQAAGGHIRQVEDAQTGPVVGLVAVSLVVVEVVVDGGRRTDVCSDQLGRIEVQAVEDVGPGVHAALIVLVVDEQIALILGQPALVGVGGAGIARVAQHDGVAGVGDVHHGDGILVEREGNLLAHVLGIRAVVDHNLGVVGVAVFSKAANQCRRRRGADVEDV